ncbi:CBS domain-containing protein CBSX1, chloroplastic-like isoform X2 [Hibiscus syriacus]|uniref:CBS domain-containing protein CBSX1, chloroplastic-like isoform X2 n=1 Tax=Hibiscus syriacus TaxID=106335 RepID=UPI00192482A3|nr:CBS domain-containing protein CBSX1, chloroplastic-like isoform X2 [Hibiscus syriacus]
MDSILRTKSLSLTRLRATSTSTVSIHHMPCQLVFRPAHALLFPLSTVSAGFGSRRSFASVVAASDTLTANSVSPRVGVYTVGDFMTRKEDLHVVKPTTTVDEALEALVEHRIAGFPVIDDDWKLVGLVSDYDLLALDSISGQRTENVLFPEVDSTWKIFNEVQKLLSKTNGQVVGDLMTPAPLVVRETTNLEDAARWVSSQEGMWLELPLK